MHNRQADHVVAGVDHIDPVAFERGDLDRGERAEVRARVGQGDGVAGREGDRSESSVLCEVEVQPVVAGVDRVDSGGSERCNLRR
ncbi:MAG TPA: hypothetical protein DIU07_05475 [Rhodobacteraceae bacterium]|nr:hypothetical protein [Paracoccaceae bacterium]